MYTVSWQIIDENGYHVDSIRDTFPIPDILHILQTSVAFFEKTWKYLICLYDSAQDSTSLKKYSGHNLKQLRSLLYTCKPEYWNNLSSNERDCLLQIEKIDYTVLRYLDKSAPKFEIDFLVLKELIKHTFEFLKKIRFIIYSDKAKVQELNQKSPTIRFTVRMYDQPLRSILKDSFEEVIEQKLSQTEREFMERSYRFDDRERRYFLIESDPALLEQLHLIFKRAKFVFPDFGKLEIEIGR